LSGEFNFEVFGFDAYASAKDVAVSNLCYFLVLDFRGSASPSGRISSIFYLFLFLLLLTKFISGDELYYSIELPPDSFPAPSNVDTMLSFLADALTLWRVAWFF
jgi:hypothetical protein